MAYPIATSGAELLALADREIRLVEIPEWHSAVHVRTMSAGELDRWQAATQSCPVAERHARLVQATACHADGELLFDEDAIPCLMGKRGSVLDRLADVAFALNGLGEDPEKKTSAPQSDSAIG